MTIVSVDRMWSRTASDASLSDNFRKLTVNFKECFQVVTTVGTEVFEVYAAIDPTTGLYIPRAGELYPGTASCYAMKADPKRVSPIMWLVDVSWTGEAGPNGPTDNPINKPPSIDWDDVETEEEIDEDWDGNPILNFNNEPITGIKVPIADQVLNIQRNFATFSPYAQSIYRRSVNSDNFAGWPPGTARLTKLKAKNVFDATMGYWQVSATIRFRVPYRTTPDKAWYARVRHEGFMERLTAGAEPTKAFDKVTKSEVTKPILLKANGTREDDPANAIWLEFKKYDSLPFSALGLL